MAAGDPHGRPDRTVGDLSARYTIWNKKWGIDGYNAPMRLENAYEYPAMRLTYSPACFCTC